VYGYSETGWGGWFQTKQIGANALYDNAGGLRVIGKLLHTDGEYARSLQHPDGSERVLYTPLSPEGWCEDFGRLN
jgi:hypothetical protein